MCNQSSRSRRVTLGRSRNWSNKYEEFSNTVEDQATDSGCSLNTSKNYRGKNSHPDTWEWRWRKLKIEKKMHTNWLIQKTMNFEGMANWWQQLGKPEWWNWDFSLLKEDGHQLEDLYWGTKCSNEGEIKTFPGKINIVKVKHVFLNISSCILNVCT